MATTTTLPKAVLASALIPSSNSCCVPVGVSPWFSLNTQAAAAGLPPISEAFDEDDEGDDGGDEAQSVKGPVGGRKPQPAKGKQQLKPAAGQQPATKRVKAAATKPPAKAEWKN